MSTQDSIAEHNRRWAKLPAFPEWPYVVTDSDIEAWSDMLYLRTLADDIEDAAEVLAADPIADHVARLQRLLFEVDVPLAVMGRPLRSVLSDAFGPWPHDWAADLLEAWRRESQAAAA